jgi:hypothetical protein
MGPPSINFDFLIWLIEGDFSAGAMRCDQRAIGVKYLQLLCDYLSVICWGSVGGSNASLELPDPLLPIPPHAVRDRSS